LDTTTALEGSTKRSEIETPKKKTIHENSEKRL